MGISVRTLRHPPVRRVIVGAGLILANLVPLVGVLGFGWNLYSLLVIYWLESGVVGAAYVAKILRAQGGHERDGGSSGVIEGLLPNAIGGSSNVWIAAKFVLFFGTLWGFYGLAISSLPAFAPGLDGASPVVVAVSFVVLAGHHAVSYRVNYVGMREYERNDPTSVAWEVAPRLLGLHLIVVVGGNAIALFGAQVGALVLLVLVKTVVDLVAHAREHDRARVGHRAKSV